MVVKYLDNSIECATALKGDNYVHLLDANGDMIAAFDEVSDFSGFKISGGNWTTPTDNHHCYIAVVRDDGTIAKGGHKCSDIQQRDRVVNLLDNSDFRNPINQRGQTTYSKAYTIDRWSLLYNDVSTLNVTSDGLKFTSGSGDCWLLQRFERPLKVGAPYTFAVQYADGTKDVISVNVEEASAYRQGAHCIYSISNAHFAIVGRDIPNGIVIQWAALYEGAYDAETLPAYQYKGYAAELAECQRYFVHFGPYESTGFMALTARMSVDTCRASFPLPVTMRAIRPTISFSTCAVNGMKVTAMSGAEVQGANLTAIAACDASAMSYNAPLLFVIESGGYINFSADL